MPNLTHLGISNGLLEDADLTGPDSFLQHFKGLKSLSLNGNLLTEFDASRHLPDNVRSTLESLSLAYNPLTETNLDGIDLPVLPIQSTRITVLDDAVLSMENLQHFSWRNDHLTNEGLGDGDAVGAFARYPETLRVSHHTDMLGNPFDSDDTGIEAEAVVVQIAHADRMKEINDAAGGKVVLDRFLGDPCRPQIDIFDTFQQWSEAGDLCLTPAQTSDWVASLDGFNGLQSVRALSLDLTDDRAGTLLDNIDGKPILTVQIAGAPDAFGAGFIDSKLDAFDSLGSLRGLNIHGTQLNLNQAKENLGKLKAKYISDGSPAKHSDLSYHPHLFAAASVNDVTDFLNGVTTTDDSQWPDFRLGLRETGLTFPHLKAIIDSMDDDLRLRHLDVSLNPSLWTGASDPEFTALFERMKVATSIDVGHTGMTGNRASLMFNALAGNGGTEVDTNGGSGKASVKHSLARMTFLGLDGNDLTTGIELDTAFGLFAGRYPSSEGTLSYLGLEDTKIGFDDLADIVTGLVNAELVDQIRHLRIGRSNEVWSDPAATQTGITNLFAKFKNLRVLGLNGSGISLEQLGWVLDGLDQADVDTDNYAGTIRTVGARRNPDLLAPLTDDDGVVTETAAQHAARLAPIFAKSSHAFMTISNSGLSQEQLDAITTAASMPALARGDTTMGPLALGPDRGELPETGAAAASVTWSLWTLMIGVSMLATAAVISRRRTGSGI